jgi:type I restriction enzyme S subunit
MATVPLQEIAQVIRGVTFDKHEALDEWRSGYRPVLRAGNIDTSLLIDQDLVWVPERRIADEQRMLAGDIAICMSSGSQAVVGKTAALKVDWPGSVGAFCAIVRPRPARVLPEWLGFFLRSELFRTWTRQSTGANIKNIRKSELETFPVPLPSPVAQQRIVDLLSRAEGIVRLRRQAQQKAAELIPAIFADMFGDPATNPKGWPTRPLSDLVEFQSGGTPSKARGEYWQGDVPWVSPKDMKRLALYDAIDHISDLVLAETSLKLVPAGSVLIVVRGMILAHTVPVAEARVPLTVNQDMKALISKGAVHSTYLLWMLQVCHDRLLAQVTTAAHGTKKLDTARLEEMPIPLPPASMQQAFETNVRRMEAIQEHQVNAAAKAEAAFSALLARAFVAEGAGAAVREAEEVGS